MLAWDKLVLVLAACGGTPEPAEEADTSGPPGIEREVFERLYRERYCEEWPICSDAGACPLDGDTQILTDPCAYDPVAAQACIVGKWTCKGAGGFPKVPDVCATVCDGDDDREDTTAPR